MSMTVIARLRRLAVPAAMAGALLLAACTAPGGGAQTAPTDTAETAASADPTAEPTAAPVALTIGLTYVPNVQFAPFYLAEANGYYAEAGLDVELRHHGGSESLFGAIASGQEDIVIAGGDEMLQARAEGTPLVSVATLYQEYPVALIVPAESDVTGVEDIEGLRIGIPGPWGQTWFGLLALLDAAGLAEDDVQIEHIGYTQQAALIAGQVDAVMGFVNNDAVQFEIAELPVRTIGIGAAGDVPLVGIGLGTTDELIADESEAIAAFVAATLRGVEDVIADPAGAVEASADHIPGMTSAQHAAALATVEATIPLYGDASGQADLTAWRAMAAFMGERGLLSGEVDVFEAVTNELLASR